MTGPLDTARAAWGEDMPDWVETLAIQCGKTSQAKVAKLLDRSPTVVSQILNRKYPADTAGIEERVRGVFQHVVIQCPAQQAIPAHACQDSRSNACASPLPTASRRRLQPGLGLSPLTG